MKTRAIAVVGLAVALLAIPCAVWAQPVRTIGTNGAEAATAIQTWGGPNT